MEIVTESLVDVVRLPIASAGNTSQVSESVDMTGFLCALFETAITGSANNGKAEMRIEASSDNATWAELDIAEVAATAAAANGLNGKVLQIEVKRPLQRYLRARLLSTQAAIAFGPTLARRYAGMRTPPPGSDDSVGEAVVASPVLKG